MPRLLVGSILVLAAFLALGNYGMRRPQPDKPEAPVTQEPQRDQFAADRDSATPPTFDAKRAMGYLEAICKLGPRVSSSEGMKKQQAFIKEHFEKLGAKVARQEFQAKQLSRPRPTAMANLIVSWNPDAKRRVILCSHYDTRPIADHEPDERKWHQPFVSANDGGSGVALLMELGNHMTKLNPAVGVEFVFFDGEEYIFEPEKDKYFFGSEHFAQNFTRTRAGFRYVAAVLLDMIGGKEVHIPAEQNSYFQARALVEELWKIAAELKCPLFENQVGVEVRDDHIALNRAGIPTVDLIDINYPHWHLLSDVPANCSGESMGQVAGVLMVWLQRQK
jgi:hypothetical protein